MVTGPWQEEGDRKTRAVPEGNAGYLVGTGLVYALSSVARKTGSIERQR